MLLCVTQCFRVCRYFNTCCPDVGGASLLASLRSRCDFLEPSSASQSPRRLMPWRTRALTGTLGDSWAYWLSPKIWGGAHGKVRTWGLHLPSSRLHTPRLPRFPGELQILQQAEQCFIWV